MKPPATIRLALGATAIMAAVAIATGHVHAADAIKPGARLAASCSGCHGTNGATQGSTLPRLAGQQKDILLEKLKAYKSGAVQSTIMTQIAKGYTDDQLATLAAYFSTQPGSDPAGLTPPLGSKN